jgi:hypothetical protein
LKGFLSSVYYIKYMSVPLNCEAFRTFENINERKGTLYSINMIKIRVYSQAISKVTVLLVLVAVLGQFVSCKY